MKLARFFDPFGRFFAKKNGYTLFEITISISIIAVLAAGGLKLIERKGQRDEYRITQERVEVIRDALIAYIKEHKKVPCPADPNLPEGEQDEDFGKSVDYDPVTGKCANPEGSFVYNPDQSGTPYANNGLTHYRAYADGNNVGAVPVAEIGLSYDYTYDAWARKFTYRTAPFSGSPDSFNQKSYPGGLIIGDSGGMKKSRYYDDVDKEWKDDGGVFVIISHGQNGDNMTFERSATGRADGVDLTADNIGINYGLVGGAEANHFMHHWNSYTQDVRTQSFDDIVAFATIKDFRSEVESPVTSPLLVNKATCDAAREVVKAGAVYESSITGGVKVTTGSPIGSFGAGYDRLALYKSIAAVDYMCLHQESNYSPDNVLGLKLWIDASDLGVVKSDASCTNSIDGEDGDAVVCIKDKSGHDHHASVSGGSASYLNDFKAGGKGVLDLGSNKFLAIGGGQPVSGKSGRTVFLVTRHDGIGTKGIFALASGGGKNKAYDITTQYNGAQFKANVNGLPSYETNLYTQVEQPDEFYLIVARNDEASGAVPIDVRFNGRYMENKPAVSSNVNTASSSTVIGKSRTEMLGGAFAEAIVYDRRLTDDELFQVERYLTAKWGLDTFQDERCQGGLVFRVTKDKPEGGCYCPDHEQNDRYRLSIKPGNACDRKIVNVAGTDIPASGVFGACTNAYSKPIYSNPPAPHGLALWVDGNDCTQPMGDQSVMSSVVNSSGDPYVWDNTLKKGYLSFDGSPGRYIKLAQVLTRTDPFTMFLVVKSDTISADNPILHFNQFKLTTEFAVEIKELAQRDDDGDPIGPDTAKRLFSGVTIGSDFSVIMLKSEGAKKLNDLIVRFNGNDVSSTGVTTPAAAGTQPLDIKRPSDFSAIADCCSIGLLYDFDDPPASVEFDGDIGEVIIYKRNLTDAQIQEIESYLSDKWGVTLTP